MSALKESLRAVDWHRVQQNVKWTVYALLLLNWFNYIYEDANRAYHTLTDSSNWFAITSEFATSIDVAAWFILLIMLELETYILEDEAWDGWVAKVVRGIRIVCFVMIAHTIVANANAVRQYLPENQWGQVTDLCELSSQDISFVYNLDYTEITEESCADLPKADKYYQVGVDPVVSTYDGLKLELDLAWADLIEVVLWVLIIFAIELVVRMQDRGITGDALMTFLNRSKVVFYLILAMIAVYWGWLGHWIYTWDEFLWIAGFWAIEMNVSEWRDELLELDGAEKVTGA